MAEGVMAQGYDIVGDVHGCYAELIELLDTLGYVWTGEALLPPAHRQLVFVGDLVDRGPHIAEVVHLVETAIHGGAALSVRGNHDERLARALKGEPVKTSTSLSVSLDQLSRCSEEQREAIQRFLLSLPTRLSLDEGRLMVVHAGEIETDHEEVRVQFNVHGGYTGRLTPGGARERVDWVPGYRGAAWVVYGHTPVLDVVWRGRTLNVDTGCVFGGELSALRYPEMTTATVPARRAYASTAHWRVLTGSR